MDEETIRDIHNRLGRIEKDTKTILAKVEGYRWLKRHIWALWGAILALLGLKGV